MQETQETWIWSLGQEDPLEKALATHASILAWKIPGTENPGGLQSMESQRVRNDWLIKHSTAYTNHKQIEYLNYFVGVQLTYNKLHIFKVYNWISFTYTYIHKTITTIKKTNLSINLRSFLWPFVVPLSPVHALSLLSSVFRHCKLACIF